MELWVFRERDNSTATVDFSGKTVKDLLAELRINPETVLVVRQGEVVPEETLLTDKDRIELLSVISGG